MTTSVRFTRVLALVKMNVSFISHRNFFLPNLIDHAINHLSSHGYNFEGVFVFYGVFVFKGSSFSRGLGLQLYLIFFFIKRTVFKAYNTIFYDNCKNSLALIG